MDWDAFRRPDYSINLVAAFSHQNKWGPTSEQLFYLERIERLQPIKSRQVAAVALSTALMMNKE